MLKVRSIASPLIHGSVVYEPFVVCDLCGHPIDLAAEGVMMWISWNTGSVHDETTSQELFTLHKDCKDAWRSQKGHRNYLWMWEELKLLPPYLKHNLGIDKQA